MSFPSHKAIDCQERRMCARITLMSNEFTLAPESFHESFCADIAPDDAAFYAISRPPSPALR